MNNIKNVCIANNLYCILLYLLITEEEDIKRTFFFFYDDVPDSIVVKFNNSVKFNYAPTKPLEQTLFVIKLRLLANTKYRFIKKSEIYGQDNLLISSPLIGKKTMNVIEDGLATYTRVPRERKNKIIKKIIGGPLMSQRTQGYSSSVKKIFMTGMAPVPVALNKKVELINIKELWNNSSNEKRNTIINSFNLSAKIIEDFKQCDSILITQPLSEDKVISEDEKIQIYRKMIGSKRIAIKPHPRETTNYKKYFPNLQVLSSQIPLELLSLVGISFSDVYTVFSTAAMQIPGNPIIHFAGTQIHPALVNKFGDVKYVDGKVISNII